MKYLNKDHTITGPGHYDIPAFPSGPRIAIRGRRIEMTNAEPTPGPAHYEIPSFTKGPAFTIHGRRITQNQEDTVIF